jgi:hypothetical protein
MRSSNWEDLLNFHFLMIVQMMATPPTLAAITMSTVNVVRVILEALLVATAEVVAEAAAAAVVMVTCELEGSITALVSGAAEVVGRATLVVFGRIDEDEVEESEAEEVVVVRATVLEVVAVFVSELMMLLKPKGSVTEVEELVVTADLTGVAAGLVVAEPADVPDPEGLTVGGPPATPITVGRAVSVARFLIRRLRLTCSRR